MSAGAVASDSVGLWLLLAGAMVCLLTVDLWSYRGDRKVSPRAALGWSVAWIGLGLAFGGYVAWRFGGVVAQEYYAAYAMEKSLSLDNIFVFHVIFRSFDVPARRQHTVLFWGILGAVVFRGIFIYLGASALERWHWVSYIFAAILLYAAWHAWREDPARRSRSRLADWLMHHLKVAPATGEENSGFTARGDGRWRPTALLLALIAIELSDVMFAIDSVPAALSITQDRFVVYSSNVFAILGLRALYLWMAATIIRLRYLHFGLAGVLALAALKIAADHWLPIPPHVAIGTIALMIGGAVAASLRASRRTATTDPRR